MKRHLLWLLADFRRRDAAVCRAARLHPAAADDATRRRRRSPARTPFAHSIAATGILEPRRRTSPSARPSRASCSRSTFRSNGSARACRDGRSAVSRRRSPVEGPACLGASAGRVGAVPVDQAGNSASARGNSAQRGQGAGGQGQRRTDPRRIRAGPLARRPARRLGARGRRQAAAQRRGRRSNGNRPSASTRYCWPELGSPISTSPVRQSSRPRPKSRKSARKLNGPPSGPRSTARCCKSTSARGNG